ncbi:peptidase inhibitor family I36 protein [Amycolatopsis lurida]
MIRKIVAATAVLGVLPVVMGVAVASPAFADCPADTFCLYETHDYQDGEFQYKPGTTCTNLGSGIDNDANAMRNYRNHDVKLWDFPGCTGTPTYTADKLSYDSNFGNNGFSNKASSLKRI